ncbi:MAG: saccharopine dehydrogenase family protein [Saprospiraceae bacterium]
MSFLLYGANGYTGQLIARYAKDAGLSPMLAGRSEQKIKDLAGGLSCPWRSFSLSEAEKLEAALREVPVVLHAAGPFIHTARPMMQACLRTGTHYLDITGEMAVFEMAYRFDEKAKKAGVMLMPGAGFDVVPTDCLALHLKNRLPDATHLRLAFGTLGSRVSHGTAMTMVENLGEEGAVRKDGKIVRVPLGHKTLRFPGGDKSLFAMTIPWGDVSTAYRTTGIPNIEVYMSVTPSAHRQVKWNRYLGWLLRTEFVKNIARRKIAQRPAGPSDTQRAGSRSFLWGEVRNERWQIRQAVLTTPDGYTLTAMTSLLILEKVLSSNLKTGFQTPAGAYGEDLILEAEGTERRDLP